jgi:hypothetical protein
MTASASIFREYPNRVFIETGSYHGDGIQHALDAGFNYVLSIECDRDLFEITNERFWDNDNVVVFYGDSREVLQEVLEDIEEPCTFWLDSHSPKNLPLLKELEIIKNHPIKTHTILIDDLRLWSVKETGFDTATLKEILLSINPSYQFELEGIPELPNDILVATVKYYQFPHQSKDNTLNQLKHNKNKQYNGRTDT